MRASTQNAGGNKTSVNGNRNTASQCILKNIITGLTAGTKIFKTLFFTKSNYGCFFKSFSKLELLLSFLWLHLCPLVTMLFHDVILHYWNVKRVSIRGHINLYCTLHDGEVCIRVVSILMPTTTMCAVCVCCGGIRVSTCSCNV